MLKIENVNIRYKNFSLLVDKIEIKKNDIVFLIGKSGSGKTTLAHVLSGIIKCNDGKISFNGKEVNDKFLKKHVDYLSTNQILIDNYSIMDTLLLKGRKNFNINDVKIKIDYYLKELSLYEKRNTKIKYLSGGEKQRVSFIAFLLTNREIMILDEPDHYLDDVNSDLIYKILFEEKDKTLIIITHRYDKFIDNATKIVYLNNGRIDKVDERREITDSYFLECFDKRRVFLLKNDIISNRLHIALKFFTYLILMLITITLITSSYFVYNISNESTYDKDNKYFTGYNYNVEVYSKDKKIKDDELWNRVLENNYEDLFINYSTLNVVMPINDNVEMLAGKNINKNDELLLALNPSNYFTNQEKYDNLINTEIEITYYDGINIYTSNIKIIKKYKIVGIAKSNYNIYDDNHYYSTRNEFDANNDIKIKYSLYTSKKTCFIKFSDIEIDNSIPYNTISYRDINEDNIVYNVSCDKYSEDYVLNVISGNDIPKMSEKTYTEMFDSGAIIRAVFTFESKNEKNKFIEYLSNNNYEFNDVSFELKKSIMPLTISLSVVIVSLLSLVVFIIIKKASKKKNMFYDFCRIGFFEKNLSNGIIDFVLLVLINILLHYSVMDILKSSKGRNIKYYYLFGYINNRICLSIYIFLTIIIIVLDSFVNNNKKKNA